MKVSQLISTSTLTALTKLLPIFALVFVLPATVLGEEEDEPTIPAFYMELAIMSNHFSGEAPFDAMLALRDLNAQRADIMARFWYSRAHKANVAFFESQMADIRRRTEDESYSMSNAELDAELEDLQRRMTDLNIAYYLEHLDEMKAMIEYSVGKSLLNDS